MDFEWSQEQDLLRQSVRRLAEDQGGCEHARALWDEASGVTESSWKGICELGLPGLLVPEEHAGAGLSVLDMGVVLEELGRVVHPAPVLSSALVATRLLQRAGTRAGCSRWLPELAAGRSRACAMLGCGEPFLELDERGGELRLSGVLEPVLDAASCDLWLVPVPDALGRARLVRVDPAAAGVALSPHPCVDGARKLSRVELAEVTAVAVGEGDASGALAEARDLLDLGLVTEAVGSAGRALELCVDYARQREQFGRPVGSFQSLQHLIVDMLDTIELLRAATLYALWSADGASADERSQAVAVAKAWAGEALPGVGAAAIQVFGGIGFTWEMEIHLHDKRLCSQALLGRGEADRLEALAERVLGPA